ncbi:CPBP family intramembrane metalloprotease [Viridibacillus sp. YIM B01967]|uniref:CPBP family intramembrane metalloprotease n=2 Tax=Viridibacillus soli TaxID=2798301 RepID=A0ABS1HA40_9BACL|nr:CPBP family intramembrane metalloprotease [Viridibacillus soli]
MQLSSILFLRPLLRLIQKLNPEISNKAALLMTQGWWIFISMCTALIISLIIVRRDKSFWQVFKGKKASIPMSIVWGIIGFFLVFFGQTVGALIEQKLGITTGSENTANLIEIANVAPVAILGIVVFGPILEEFIFRRVIFGSIFQKTNFFIAASVSAIVFAVIHFDFSHIILYAISGFIFAFLYHKTQRIITSIIAHMMLNGFVTVIQLYQDNIVKFLGQ